MPEATPTPNPTPSPSPSPAPAPSPTPSPSPSPVAPPPACATNLLVNGDFENGVISPFYAAPGSDPAVTPTVVMQVSGIKAINNPQSGFYFLDLSSDQYASANILGQLSVKAGTLVSCGGFYNYPPDITGASAEVQIYVDDQRCGGTIEKVYYSDEWEPLSGGSAVVARDNPVYRIYVLFKDYPYTTGHVGLDGLFVTASAEVGMPFCVPRPPMPTSD